MRRAGPQPRDVPCPRRPHRGNQREVKELAREIAREVVAEQRRQELAAYDAASMDDDQVAKIQRAKMRELKRAKKP